MLKIFPLLIWIISFLISGISLLIPSEKTNRRLGFSLGISVIIMNIISQIYMQSNGIVVNNIEISKWGSYGIEFSYSIFSFLMILAFSVALCFAMLSMSVFNYDSRVVSLILISYMSFIGIVLTNDIFNLYIFLEIASISGYFLNSCGNDQRSFKYAFDYLILGSIAGLMFLMSVLILYVKTGHLNIDKISVAIQNDFSNSIKLSYILIFIVFLLKSGSYPFFKYILVSYKNLRSSIFSYLASTHTKAMLYILIMLTYKVFGTHINISLFKHFFFVTKIIMFFGICHIFLKIILTQDIVEFIILSSVFSSFYIFYNIDNFDKNSYMGIVIWLFFDSIIKSFGATLVNQTRVYNNMHKVSYQNFGKFLSSDNLYKILGTFFLLNMASTPFTIGFNAKMTLSYGLLVRYKYINLVILFLCFAMTLVYCYKMLRMVNFFNITKLNTSEGDSVIKIHKPIKLSSNYKITNAMSVTLCIFMFFFGLNIKMPNKASKVNSFYQEVESFAYSITKM